MAKNRADRPLSATMAAVLLEVMAGVSLIAVCATAAFPGGPPSRTDWAVVATPAAATLLFGICAFAVLKGLSWARTVTALSVGFVALCVFELMVSILTLGLDLAGDGDVILFFIAALVSVPPFVLVSATGILVSLRSADRWYGTSPGPDVGAGRMSKWHRPTVIVGLFLAIGCGVFARYEQYAQNRAPLPADWNTIGAMFDLVASTLALTLLVLMAAIQLSRRRESGRYFTVIACGAAIAYPFATMVVTAPPPHFLSVAHIVGFAIITGTIVLAVNLKLATQTVDLGTTA